MLRVGLTGGVGSGKSAVASLLRGHGAHVLQSDEVGRALMQPGQPAYLGMLEHFGKGVLLPGGSLDRVALARIAFQEGRVDELNAIVHPLVIAEGARWMTAVGEADPAAVAVVESALLLETKYAASVGAVAPWRTRFDRIVVVTAPLDVRRKRYIERAQSMDAQTAGADFDRRVAAQWTDEQKSALADFVVPNEGSLDDLRGRVDALWGQLKAEAGVCAMEAM